MTLEATIVFEKLWKGIHEKCHQCGGESRECTFCQGSGRQYRYILLPGSSRSSKTHSIIQSHYLYAFAFKQKRISVWRPTKKECRDTVGKDMEVLYPSMQHADLVVFNRTEHYYRFPTGSVIELCGTDEPNRVHGYNGNVLHLNEPYQIPRDVFDQLDMRTTDYVICDYNPKEQHWTDDLSKDPRALVIHSTFRDNPFCPPEQKAKILSYQPLKMCRLVEEKLLTEDQARTYDILENVSGFAKKDLEELSRCRENETKGSASVFNWQVYGLGVKSERPNRIFHWHEIPDHEYFKLDATRYYGIDWGVVDPWAVVEAKYYDGALYLHELNYKSENEIRESLDLETLEKINRTEEGLVKHMIAKMGVDPKSYILCDTNRPLKIMALREAGFEYATTAPKPPGSVIDGINILKGLKVYFTSSSTSIKNEQELYSRQVDRYGIVLEEPEDKDNHTMDAVRYIALYLSLAGIIRQ
jgi:PBSX family phage terminase large subunit